MTSLCLRSTVLEEEAGPREEELPEDQIVQDWDLFLVVGALQGPTLRQLLFGSRIYTR
jgi:hypothetical protein